MAKKKGGRPKFAEKPAPRGVTFSAGRLPKGDTANATVDSNAAALTGKGGVKKMKPGRGAL